MVFISDNKVFYIKKKLGAIYEKISSNITNISNGSL